MNITSGVGRYRECDGGVVSDTCSISPKDFFRFGGLHYE